VVDHAGCDKHDSLMRGGLCGKLHGPPSQLFAPQQSSIDSQIFFENRDLCLSHLNSTPPLGGPRWNIAITFGVEKLEWCGHPTVKKFEDTFVRFGRMYERDGQTDIQTPHDGIGRAYAERRPAETMIRTWNYLVHQKSPPKMRQCVRDVRCLR